MNQDLLKTKLRKVDTTKDSIQSISRWCKFYKKEYKAIVAVWFSEFIAANAQRKLAMIYLCSDIIQTTLKDGTEFAGEFYQKLPKVIKEITKGGDVKINGAMSRVLNVWEDRKIFGNSGVPRLLQVTGFKLSAFPDPRAKSPSTSPNKPRQASEKEELRKIREFSGDIDKTSDEIRRLERHNRDSLSTSGIVEGRSDDGVLSKYQKLTWNCIDKERKLMAVLEDWRSKIEGSISNREERIKQIKKDIILGQNKRKEEEKAPLVAAQAPGAEKVDVAKVANELSRDENAVKIMQAIKTLSPNDLEALKGAIKMGNQPASASQEEKSAKRVRTE